MQTNFIFSTRRHVLVFFCIIFVLGLFSSRYITLISPFDPYSLSGSEAAAVGYRYGTATFLDAFCQSSVISCYTPEDVVVAAAAGQVDCTADGDTDTDRTTENSDTVQANTSLTSPQQ